MSGILYFWGINLYCMKAIVIGAGIGGLSTAIRLRKSGWEVIVLEASTGPGGKLGTGRLGDYRFDLGPSLFTMPELVTELFTIHGKNPDDYFRFQKLDTICHYFYEDGTRFRSSSNTEQFETELHEALGLPKGSLRRFLKSAQRIHSITTPLFLYKSLHRIKSYLSWNTFLSILRLPWIHAHHSMHSMNKIFFKDPRMVQYFNRYATYNGSNPYRAPGTLNLIAHLEHHEGAYLPEHGMYDITQAMYTLAKEVGVEFQFQHLVTRILHENGRVRGVQSTGKEYDADVVISNMDIFPCYRKLLPDLKAPEKILHQEKSSSALIFYWGIKKEFKELGLHNILFSANYEEEFRAIWDKKTIGSDPTIYINITSKYVREDAPEGGENWFVMINVPCHEGQDWDSLRREARKNILAKINRMLGTSLEEYLEVEDYLDPIRIEERTQSHRGALYGNASNNSLAAFFRQANFSQQLKGLYFAGGSVHPGGGVPLANLSGKIAASLIEDDFRQA
jgi:phytoene desaturase